MKGYASVAAALAAWDAQSLRSRLEVLVLCPSGLGPAPGDHNPAHIVVDTGSAGLHEARALGIAHATAPYIMLAEDHCLPDPSWAESILARIDEGWDGVVSTLRPGTRAGAFPQASFLIGYGEWMEPVTAGPTGVMCGWNGVIRRDLLLAIDPAELRVLMCLGAFLVRHIRQQGARYFLESRARMRHFDPPGAAYECFLLFLVGLGFGAMRTRRWFPPLRVFYLFLFPAIAAAHFRRAVRQFRRAPSAIPFAALLAAFVLAGFWGLGESIGAIAGLRAVSPHLWRTEVKPVTQAQLDASDRFERRI